MKRDTSREPKQDIQASDDLRDLFWWDYVLDWDLRKRGYVTGEGPADPNLRKSFRNENSLLSDHTPENKPLTYRHYIQVEKLLDSQVPHSVVPDERVFIIVHQIFELLFKQIIFDLEIVYETLNKLEQFDAVTFDRLSKLEIPAEFYAPHRSEDILQGFFREEDRNESVDSLIKFWLPAIFAANRLVYSGRQALGSLGGLFGSKNFSGFEFAQFRPLLLPASGFQTEQFRTLQRTLGKAQLMNYVIFASHEYIKRYHGGKDAPHSIKNFTSITDKRVYDRKDEKIKRTGDGNSPAFPNKQKDLIQCVNRILSKFYAANRHMPYVPPRERGTSKIADVERQLVKYLDGLDIFMDYPDERGKAATIKELRQKFTSDLKKDLADQRKLIDKGAAKGAGILFSEANSKTVLHLILSSLNELDKALHDKEGSFLAGHIKMVENQISIVQKVDELNGEVAAQGTGGGGRSYLEFMLELYQLFPAFPVLRDAES